MPEIITSTATTSATSNHAKAPSEINSAISLPAKTPPLSSETFSQDLSALKSIFSTATLDRRDKNEPRKEFRPVAEIPWSIELPPFAPFAFERRNNGRIYEMMGVRFFQKWAPTPDKLFGSALTTKQYDANEKDLLSRLKRFANATAVYEILHASFGAYLLINSLNALGSSGIGGLFLNLAGNLLINGYPIISQRYNRIRIQRIFDVVKKQREQPTT